MIEKLTIPGFLKEKYWTFEDFREIAKKSSKRRIKKIPPEPVEQIINYLERLDEILKNPRGKEKLENLIFKKIIIKPENITPEIIKKNILEGIAGELGYQKEELKNENVKKIVLEKFEQEIGKKFEKFKVSKELLEQERNRIIGDQKHSLKHWLDYLTSLEAENYPPEFRYWVFVEVLKLGSYDEKRRKFNERTDTTIAPFPELNYQALSIVLDELLRKYQKEPSQISPTLEPEEKQYFQNLIKNENFGNLYAFALKYIERLKSYKERLPIILGEWQEFTDENEANELALKIRNFKTGWCIVCEPTAKSYLKNSNILIYFSQDENGNNTIPRLAIVTDKNTQEIQEIRGISNNQNLDPYINPVLETKLKQIPNGLRYLEKLNNVKELTKIYFKFLNKKELTKKELRFLYQIDREIISFGDSQDPRIKKILESRNFKKDLSKIFNCQDDQIALNMEELTENTVVLYGNFDARKYKKNSLPPSLKFIKGEAILTNSQLEDLGNLEIIGGDAFFTSSKIKSLGSLQIIGGTADFTNSQVENIGNLKEIKKNAFFKNSKIKSLGKLKRIGEQADFNGSLVEDLGDLKIIDGGADFGNSQIKSLGKLKRINWNANFENSLVEDLGDLEIIGRSAIFKNSKIKSLGKLKVIGSYANFASSLIENLGNLEIIGRNIYIDDKTPEKLIEGIRKRGWENKIIKIEGKGTIS